MPGPLGKLKNLKDSGEIMENIDALNKEIKRTTKNLEELNDKIKSLNKELENE